MLLCTSSIYGQWMDFFSFRSFLSFASTSVVGQHAEYILSSLKSHRLFYVALKFNFSYFFCRVFGSHQLLTCLEDLLSLQEGQNPELNLLLTPAYYHLARHRIISPIILPTFTKPCRDVPVGLSQHCNMSSCSH